MLVLLHTCYGWAGWCFNGTANSVGNTSDSFPCSWELFFLFACQIQPLYLVLILLLCNDWLISFRDLCSFLQRNVGWDLGEKEAREGIGRNGRRENYSWDILYERGIKNKERTQWLDQGKTETLQRHTTFWSSVWHMGLQFQWAETALFLKLFMHANSQLPPRPVCTSPWCMSNSLSISTSYGLRTQSSSSQFHVINSHSLLTGELTLPNMDTSNNAETNPQTMNPWHFYSSPFMFHIGVQNWWFPGIELLSYDGSWHTWTSVAVVSVGTCFLGLGISLPTLFKNWRVRWMELYP